MVGGGAVGGQWRGTEGHTETERNDQNEQIRNSFSTQIIKEKQLGQATEVQYRWHKMELTKHQKINIKHIY